MSWLKCFGLSFFSDKISKEAGTRGTMNCVLGFVLTLVFFYCGLLMANTVPFYTNYDKSSGFKEFFYETVEQVKFTVSENRISSDKVINTFEDGTGAGRNGYNLIIDTRPSDTLDDFEAYCAPKSGELDELSYEDYLALPKESKGNYEFKIRYTPNVLVLTDEKISGFENYLSASETESVKNSFSELSKNKEKLSKDEYNFKLYDLYIHTYYPEISAYEQPGYVPMLRSYYYVEYLSKDEVHKTLFVFDDLMFGYFETDSGLEVGFYGSYQKAADGAVTKEGADEFIKGAFASMVPLTVNVYIMSVIRLLPFIILIPLVIAMIAKLVFTLLNIKSCKNFITCFKIVCSYLWMAALITALITFICGYFTASGILNIVPLIVLAAVLLIRVAVLIILEYLRSKKQPAQSEEES